MDAVSLIPKSKKDENLDVSHIIRDVFQLAIETPKLPENVTKNLVKFNIENGTLKRVGKRATRTYNDCELTLDDVVFVEKSVMCRQALVLMEKDLIESVHMVKEMTKLKRQSIYVDLPDENIKKYGLIQKTNLLPTKPEIAMDFRINANQHRCLVCPTEDKFYKKPQPNDKIKLKPDKKLHNEILSSRECVGFKPRYRKLSVPLKDTPRTQNLATLRHSTMKLETQEIFKPEPPIVIFSDYLMNITYEKNFKLRNVSKTTQAFLPSVRPKGSCFKVDLHRESQSRIAPGMCAMFIVQFKPDCYYDREEFVYFTSHSGYIAQVSLICQRTPPELTVYVFKSHRHFLNKCKGFEKKQLDEERMDALNSTIDCGGALLGRNCNIALLLGNSGSTGKFFIINEKNWNDLELTNVNEEMGLSTETFHIYPAFFEIRKNEMVVIDVTFTPSIFGLEVEKFFLVCDNNAVDEFEIIGDGITFDKNLVTIQIDDLSDVKIQEEKSTIKETKYVINFGRCIANKKFIRSITVHNNSTLDLPCKWKLSDNDYNEKSKLTKQLNPNYLTLVDKCHNLQHLSEFTFEVVLDVPKGDQNYGEFSLVYELYVLDVPEIALEENKYFYCIDTTGESVVDNDDSLEKGDEEEEEEGDREELIENLESTHGEEEEEEEPLPEELKSIDVMVAKIEILCTIEPICIYILPPSLKYTQVFGVNTVIKKKLQIYSTGMLNCKWQNPKHKEITINPMEFLLNPYNKAKCYLEVLLNKPKTIRETLTLITNENIRGEFEIELKVIRHKVIFVPKFLNFGLISTSSTALKQEIVLSNTGDTKLEWRIIEFTYDFNREAMNIVRKNNALSYTKGILEPTQECPIYYTLCQKKLRKPTRWFSMLVLFTKDPRVALDLCYVTFEVVQPQITLHTSPTTSLILSHKKVLYVGTTENYFICVENTGGIATNFKFETPIGSEVNKLRIKISPTRGIVEPNNCTHVTIVVSPLECGFVSEVFLPCFVREMPDPYLVNLLCAVDALNVVFYLPIKDKNYQKVWWPPRLDEGSTIELDVEQEEEYVKTDANFSSTRNSLCSLLKSEKHNNSLVDVIKYTNEGMDDYYAEEEATICPEITIDDTFENTETSIDESSVSSVSLLSGFGSDAMVQSYAIQFYKVPLRTPIKRTLMMRNVTPIPANFCVEAINFHTVDDYKEEKIKRDIMSQLKSDKIDLWEESIKNDKGIVVKIDPYEGHLEFKKMETVDIWVYANTWGTYLEEIVVDMSDIVPFCFNLVVEIIGMPLEFPIALNSIQEDVFVRFGTIAYLSDPIERNLKITNTSAIPIGVAWHVFNIPKIVSRCGIVSPKDPFNLVVDVYERPIDEKPPNVPSETDIKCMVTSRYYGKEDFDIFDIKPRDIRLLAKSTETIKIILNPKHYEASFKTTPIKAYLRGHIHIDNKFSFQENLFYRPMKNELISKVKLTATLELPLLKLELVRGDTRFSAFANDIYEAEEMTYEKTLVFKNLDKSPVKIYMHILSPFKIVSLRTAQTNTDKNPLAAVVQPGECVEVIVQCNINRDQVLKCSDILYDAKLRSDSTVVNLQNQSIMLTRFINIHQLGLEKQILKMQFTIFYPVLRVSADFIDFGMVFLKNTKKMIVTLTNPTGSHIPFSIKKQTEALTVVPAEGSVPKANGISPSSLILSLYFIPDECQVYQDTVRISTNMPFYNFEVNVMGTGSNNEKFFLEGL